MNPQLEKLYHIGKKRKRIILGLMSGTSLDGLDLALCEFEGSGLDTTVNLLKFTTIPYTPVYREHIKSVFSKKIASLEKVCLLNAWVGLQHASIINQCLKNWQISSSDIDLIASHGQTIFHAPQSNHQIEGFPNATLQIGDGDHIAHHTGIITISDFRQKHIAAGGEGAPLAVYGDFLLFSSPNENRVLLNMGGIANFTYLPHAQDSKALISTDTGPGNTIMDAYIQQHFPGQHFDENARVASQGKVSYPLLYALKDHPFFQLPLPKTTGPELFNLEYLKIAQAQSNTTHLPREDTMTTLNAFTATTLVEALQSWTDPQGQFTLYASGGGIHNPLLMNNIQALLPNHDIKTTHDLSIPPDAKEAVLFAVLANECIAGSSGYGVENSSLGTPDVRMGKVCLGG